MYDSKFYYLTRLRLKCKECNREFELKASDLKKSKTTEIQYFYECPRCCAKNSILYNDLPVSLRDTI